MSRPSLKVGRVHKRFKLANVPNVTLRVLRWEDLDSLLSFINNLVQEKHGDSNSGLYAGFDRRLTREEEAEWLAHTLMEIERGDVVSVIAEISGRIIANGEVTRGRYEDTHHHGHLGLTMISKYRGQGIGHRILETLVQESRKIGLKTLDAEFLAENKMARRAYEKAGFKQAGMIPDKVFRDGKYFDGLIMAREL
ncbi:MAG TPA: GNAT family protein [Candidatus Bathyarchaeia archaeon]|nr:GNAT family protein [Candidatus Bathyarchaeia archaeon]